MLFKHVIVNKDFSFFHFLSYSYLSLPTHCRYKGFLLHLITFNDTHTHTYSIELLWIWDRPVAETSTFTVHNTRNLQTSSERPQTHASDGVVTGTDRSNFYKVKIISNQYSQNSVYIVDTD